jgi:periodic tryptophan protein 1
VIEDELIKPTDFVIVCAHNEDDLYSLQASFSKLFPKYDASSNTLVHSLIAYIPCYVAKLSPRHH